jgi:hypothetical protein
VGAEGTEVKVLEETRYPFEEAIEFTVSTPKPVRFPLYLRLPRWCEKPGLVVNGQDVAVDAKAQHYAVIDRQWSEGDRVRLTLPMHVSVWRWEKNRNSVSVDRGPLTYSLRVGETWKKYGGSEQWPEHEVLPSTPWNYGLVLDEKDPAASFEVARREAPIADQPWVPDGQPVVLKAKARKIPAWKTDAKGLIRPLPQSPVKSAEPVETIELIPMGCARLRISQFPVIGEGADAKEWRDDPPPPPPVSASHVFGGDTVEALIDGAEPKSSNDQSIPRFTWWDHKGGEEWVQWDFKSPRKVAAVQVYWFDDRQTGGGCAVPASWQVLYRDKPAGEWKPVKLTAGSGYGVERDRYNKAAFEPLVVAALRVVVKLRPGLSGGILEWRAE